MLILADLRTQSYCDRRRPAILALKHVPLCNRALTFDIISLIVRLLEPYKGCSNGSGRLHKYVMDLENRFNVQITKTHFSENTRC